MIQRKRFRNCNIQTSTLEKEAKLPASYQGPNRQNCLLLNDDKLTEPLYSRSSDYVRPKFFQLKFDRNQMIHSFHVRMLFIRPRLNILIFLPFSGWKYSYGSWRFCSFLLCYIYGTNPVSHVPFIKLSLASNIWLWQAQNFFNFFFYVCRLEKAIIHIQLSYKCIIVPPHVLYLHNAQSCILSISINLSLGFILQIFLKFH